MTTTAGSSNSCTAREGGIGIGQVVERQLLAVQLPGLNQVRPRRRQGRVQRSALVGIFAVPQSALAVQNQSLPAGEGRRLAFGRTRSVQIRADGGIVSSRVLERFQSQSLAQDVAGGPVILLQITHDVAVLVREAHKP